MLVFDVRLDKMTANVYVYELWRVLARTSPNKNWLWEIRRIFQVGTDQAIAYILCCTQFFIHSIFVFFPQSVLQILDSIQFRL